MCTPSHKLHTSSQVNYSFHVLTAKANLLQVFILLVKFLWELFISRFNFPPVYIHKPCLADYFFFFSFIFKKFTSEFSFPSEEQRKKHRNNLRGLYTET